MTGSESSLSARRTLVTGGARSGKSSFAESCLLACEQVDYVATSARRADDAEWEARIAAHVARRPASWRTLETTDLVGVLGESSEAPVLIDCLGVWLTRAFDDADAWGETSQIHPDVLRRIDDVAAAFAATSRHVIAVTNEVGSGVVPAYPAGRQFRDALGILNARVAAACDALYLCVCGVPLQIKGPQ